MGLQTGSSADCSLLTGNTGGSSSKLGSSEPNISSPEDEMGKWQVVVPNIFDHDSSVKSGSSVSVVETVEK